MKTTTASTLAIAALAGFASTQQHPGTGLPSCALCITNMVSLHASLGCGQPNDISCLCSKPDFGFGIRDCAVQACKNAQQAERVISEGNVICGRAELAGPVVTTTAVSALAKTVEGVEVIYTTSGGILQTTTAVIGTITPTPSSLVSVSSSLASSASSTSASGRTTKEGKQQEPSSTVTEVSGTPVSTTAGSITSSSQSAAGAVITAGVGLGLVGGLVGLLL
ncbi:hypothetical protein QBC36DRAFT_51410 [Triangularia setosa]|uniref:CFEM domain-containing protein n=1 Tax=Triangularia setosa TaxID=2587417 RepID=A0AAN7A652_9PEZI|nr:hypothetical protein QBC36DRAFT_51410 [Podospora setosa]